MSKRFIARGDATISEILAAMSVEREAIAEGRVFIGRRRVVRDDERVRAGEQVLAHARPTEVVLPDPFILYRDRGVLIVDKPAHMSTVPDVTTSRGTLLDVASRAASVSNLHPTSRLDREVSGVVTFALDERAAAALQRARDAHRYERRYIAIAAGQPSAGPWRWAIGRARDPGLRRVAPDGKPSETRVRIVASVSGYSLLALSPVTGRTHQIRVHASAAGSPLLGDRAYNGPSRLTLPTGKSVSLGRVALHCARVRIDLIDCMISASSPVPPELEGLARTLGLAEALPEAIECEV